VSFRNVASNHRCGCTGILAMISYVLILQSAAKPYAFTPQMAYKFRYNIPFPSPQRKLTLSQLTTVFKDRTRNPVRNSHECHTSASAEPGGRRGKKKKPPRIDKTDQSIINGHRNSQLRTIVWVVSTIHSVKARRPFRMSYRKNWLYSEWR